MFRLVVLPCFDICRSNSFHAIHTYMHVCICSYVSYVCVCVLYVCGCTHKWGGNWSTCMWVVVYDWWLNGGSMW